MFRNQPLAYWLEYVRQFGGTDSPVLIVQTRCDTAEEEAVNPPLADKALEAFRPIPKRLHYSVRNDRGRPSLNDALSQSVEWLRGREGVAVIGAGATARQKVASARPLLIGYVRLRSNVASPSCGTKRPWAWGTASPGSWHDWGGATASSWC